MEFSLSQFSSWLADFFWPLVRIGAIFTAAPVFSGRQMPTQYRVLLALLVTVVSVPMLPKMPVVEVISHTAILLLAQQILIGLLMGFVLQMVFGGLVFGGQLIAYSMGLGFASMVDPQNGMQVPVISQIYLILATLLFLNVDGHLLLIQLVVESFRTIPVAVDGISAANLWNVVVWGSRMFAGGLLMALPVVAALLMVNLGMGVVTRAAPQFNIFAVGFPITMTLGFLIMWVSLPSMMGSFMELLNEGFDVIRLILRLVR